uniref:GMP phosphodiesterase delta subunit domain-containing protein n=1 Tax=Timema cristinae TaxID=61476 RepID=A0A7R9CEL5_TIMCR|nr:unnamed protein product [Timema cristinae]
MDKNQKRIVARREDILKGFQVNWLNIRDADTGKVLWQVYSDISVSNLEIKAKVPKQIFECRAVLTQINFSSVEPLERFRVGSDSVFSARLLGAAAGPMSLVQTGILTQELSTKCGTCYQHTKTIKHVPFLMAAVRRASWERKKVGSVPLAWAGDVTHANQGYDKRTDLHQLI